MSICFFSPSVFFHPSSRLRCVVADHSPSLPFLKTLSRSPLESEAFSAKPTLESSLLPLRLGPRPLDLRFSLHLVVSFSSCSLFGLSLIPRLSSSSICRCYLHGRLLFLLRFLFHPCIFSSLSLSQPTLESFASFSSERTPSPLSTPMFVSSRCLSPSRFLPVQSYLLLVASFFSQCLYCYLILLRANWFGEGKRKRRAKKRRLGTRLSVRIDDSTTRGSSGCNAEQSLVDY